MHQEIIVPMSRFHCELNKWIRRIDRGEHILITRNGIICCAAVPYRRWEKNSDK